LRVTLPLNAIARHTSFKRVSEKNTDFQKDSSLASGEYQWAAPDGLNCFEHTPTGFDLSQGLDEFGVGMSIRSDLSDGTASQPHG